MVVLVRGRVKPSAIGASTGGGSTALAPGILRGIDPVGGRVALWALMAMTFSIGVGEFVVLGLLPELAVSLGIDVPAAGWLVTGYALGVAIGGPMLAVTTLRVPKRRLLLTLGAFFVLGTAACALAPTYGTLLAARVLASLTHGAFVGAAAVVATRLVAPERAGAAVAAVIGGFTAATVIGVPLGTWIGQTAGWRSVFWTIAAAASLGWMAMARHLPVTSVTEPLPDLGTEVRALARASVLAALATTALGFGALFAAYTYIAPFLTEVSGFEATAVPTLLFLFGLGAIAGTALGGRLADRTLMPSLIGFLVVLALVLVLLPVLGADRVVTAVLLFVLGAAAFGATPALQLRVVGEAQGAPYLASTLNVTAFNLGNALGAFAGGVLIARTEDFAIAAWAGAAMCAAAIGVALLGTRVGSASGRGL